MEGTNEQEILRNWKIVWTTLTVILSIFVFYLGVKYNYFYVDDIGWKMIKIDCSENNIGLITECSLTSEPSACGILFHFGAGLFGFFIIQSLQIPIWYLRRYLNE